MADGTIKNNTGVHPQGPSIKKGGEWQNSVLGKMGEMRGSDGRPVNSSTLKPVKTPQHNGMSAKTSAAGFGAGQAFAKNPINGGVRI